MGKSASKNYKIFEREHLFVSCPKLYQVSFKSNKINLIKIYFQIIALESSFDRALYQERWK